LPGARARSASVVRDVVVILLSPLSLWLTRASHRQPSVLLVMQKLLHDLLQSSRSDPVPLIHRQRMFRRLNQNQRPERIGPKLNARLEQRFGIGRRNGGQPTEERSLLLPAVRLDGVQVNREALATQRHPHSVDEWITKTPNGNLEAATHKEPLLVNDAGIRAE